jgi:dihydroorotate dehydrogenase
VAEVAGGRPVWAKMSPNITDITKPALAARRAGASGVSAINTILACIGINMKTLKPLPTVEGHSTFGGYSYLAVRPIALRMVAEIARAAPGFSISGIGGVVDAQSAIEFMLCGANTVQSCTGPMLQGFGMVSEMIEGTEAFLEKHGFDSVGDIVGHSLPFFTTHHHLVELQTARKAAKAAARSNKDTEWGKSDIAADTANLTSNE